MTANRITKDVRTKLKKESWCYLLENKQPKITINDVAEHAGVSVATVSRVFNHKGIVRGETFQTVMAAVNELGYQKAILAFGSTAKDSNLSNKDLLLFNIPSLSNPFYSEIVKGAKAASTLHQCDLLINQDHINSGNLASYISMLSRVGAKGLITLNHLSSDVVQSLSDSVPLVQCCEYEEGTPVSTVGIDDLISSKNVMDYIFSLGRRRIGFINGPIEYKYSRLRLEGYLTAMKNANIEVNPNWIVQLPDINSDMAFSSAAKLLSMPNAPDAFFAVSDVCAAAVIRAASHNHLRVPEDIIVIGFDNIAISSITTPSITTVNQPKFQLGYLSCELLCETIKNPKSEIQHMLLNTELIIRESTATSPLNYEK